MHTRTNRRQFRLQRQIFSIWRPCWGPYWISRLAIIYANLCRQFQKLQTIGNILIYDTSRCTRGSGLPLERVASFTHCHPTIYSALYFLEIFIFRVGRYPVSLKIDVCSCHIPSLGPFTGKYVLRELNNRDFFTFTIFNICFSEF